ncbi:MAG: hypothetical protein AAGJ52_06130 [Pseudomonadota bacterium]
MKAMIEQQPLASPGRIWLLFDGSPGSQAALLQVLPFAQDSGRELRALYVEDLALVRCSGLSVAREVGAVSGVVRTHDEASHRYAQAVRLRRAQHCLDHLLGLTPGQVLQLESYRGEPLSVLREQVKAEDWVVVGRGGYANRRPDRLGWFAQCLVKHLSGTLLIGSPSGAIDAGPWLLLLDDNANFEHQITAALSEAGGLASAMIVIHQKELPPDLRQQIETVTPLALTWIREQVGGSLALQKLVQDYQAAGFIASESHRLVKTSGTQSGLAGIDRPYLIIRN